MPITLAEGEAVRMPEHKHKPKMVMVISIGAKPKKKGETRVVKLSKKRAEKIVRLLEEG